MATYTAHDINNTFRELSLSEINGKISRLRNLADGFNDDGSMTTNAMSLVVHCLNRSPMAVILDN